MPLIRVLLGQGYRVAVETNGGHDIAVIPKEAVTIMDIKTPASGESDQNLLQNFTCLKPGDEVKFVVVDHHDIDWSLNMIQQNGLDKICHVSMSPVYQELHPVIADKILQSGLPIRQQTQLHKLIWPDKDRGV